MPPRPGRPDELRGRVFRGSAAVRSGLLTRHQLSSSAWRRLFPDVYACTSVEISHLVRTRAVTQILVPAAVASGRTAGVLWGVDLATGGDPVECTVRPANRSGAVAGVRLTRRRLTPEEVTLRAGVPVTTPLRTALDLCRIRPLDDAVEILDRFFAARVVTLDEVRTAAALSAGRDCRHIRAVAALADGMAGSPQETRLRLLVHRSSLPDPVAQHTILDARGCFVARVDFAWPELRLALEYDGEWHAEPGQFGRDRRRLNRLTSAGWTVLFVTAFDLRHPERLLARIAEALGARSGAVR
jgi:hypothetical protein